MDILIAGGAGFIGCHLVERLLNDGHHVTVIDNFITGRRDNLARAERDAKFRLIEADLTDWSFSIGDLDTFDRIYHLASPASPVEYARIPIDTLMVNSVGTKRLLDLAHRDQARFLITSTSEVYGEPEVHPQTEDYRGNVNPVGPRSCYDEGKRFAESLTVNYGRSKQLDVRIARLFNTYGPRVSPYDGRIVSNFCIQALIGAPITVYGDGTQTRSMCYVDDTVAALIALMENDEAREEIVNIGNPQEYTVREIADIIVKLAGSNSIIVNQPLPIDDPSRRRPDITKATTLLHWSPKIELMVGLQRTLDHYRSEIGADESIVDRFRLITSGAV